MKTMNGRERSAMKVTFLGMIINIFLVILKFISGIIGGSSALISDAVHSLSDFISDVVVIVGFKFTSKPADESHNYGHGKVETVSAVIIGLLLILLSITLLLSSGTDVYDFFFNDKELAVPKFFVLYAIVSSIVLKELLFQITKVVGKRIKSEAVIANAWHHRSDAFSSVAALIGILLALLLGKDFAVCDPIASFVVSLFILKVGIDILLPGYKQLIDTSLSSDELKMIEDIIKDVKEIKGYHNIRTRRIGYYVSIDMHIFVDKNLNVEQAHEIATILENKIYHEFGNETFISVHIEPFYPNYPEIE